MTTITSEPKAKVGGLVEYPPTEDTSTVSASGPSNIISEAVDELVNSNDLTTESIAKAICTQLLYLVFQPFKLSL